MEAVVDALRTRWGIVGPLTEYPPGSLSRAWRIDTADGPVVAKLAGNTAEHLELGLRVAEVVDAAGIRAGVPIRVRDGSLSVPVKGAHLAVLEHVPGTHPGIEDLDVIELGRLLGTVHVAIAELVLPGAWTTGDVCEHMRHGLCAEQPGWVADFVLDTIDQVERWEPGREQLLRGDGPEILVADGSITGMIDWGATRWGSVADDIGCWTVHLGRLFDGYESVTTRFVDAYREVAPLTDHEAEAIPLFQRLRLADRPGSSTDREMLAGVKQWIDGWRAIHD